MSKEEQKIIRGMIKDLQFLKQSIHKKFKSNIKTQAFDNVIDGLKNNNQLDYESQSLEITFVKENIPKHFVQTKVKTLKIIFATKVKGNIDNLLLNKDPLNSLEFNIYAIGKCIEDRALRYSLHFDRHIEGGNPPEEVHPIYHFQFGGRFIEKVDIDIGQTLFFDAPRIAHHPMEFILGLDFLLSNFFPKEWRELLAEDINYPKIIKKYQEYFILPYYQSVVNHFDRKINSPWNPQEIYPQLIKR